MSESSKSVTIHFLLLTVTDTEALLSSKGVCMFLAKCVLKWLININSSNIIVFMKAVHKMLVFSYNL